MTDSSEQLFEELQNTKSIEDAKSVCSQLTKSLGCDYFLYAVRIQVTLAKPYIYVVSNYPDGWSQRYLEQNYEAVDPLVLHASQSLRPVVWSELSDENNQYFFDEAAEYGLADGITVPVYGHGGDIALFSVAVEDKDKLPSINTAAATLQFFASNLYEQINVQLKRRVYAPIQLTPREKECLRWVADGKSAWEVAQIMGIAERTVVFHLQNASSKLGASGRQHAVTKALIMGEFDGAGRTADLNWDT